MNSATALAQKAQAIADRKAGLGSFVERGGSHCQICPGNRFASFHAPNGVYLCEVCGDERYRLIRDLAQGDRIGFAGGILLIESSEPLIWGADGEVAIVPGGWILHGKFQAWNRIRPSSQGFLVNPDWEAPLL